MKLLLIILLTFSTAQVIASDELYDVIVAVADASADLPDGPHWKVSGKKLALAQCSVIGPSQVVELISTGIESFASYYVDEELPYEAAFAQLQEIAEAEPFYSCHGRILATPFGLNLYMAEL